MSWKLRLSVVLVIVTASAVSADIFVVGPDADSVLVFADDANGNETPIREISGPSTQLDSPYFVALDPVHLELFVISYSNDSILVFPLDATGDVPPLRNISGPSTGLNTPIAIIVDVDHDEIIVIDRLGHAVRVYNRTADGDAAPLRTISGTLTGLDWPKFGFLDRDTGELFVSDHGNETVHVFDRTADGDVPPLRTITGPATTIDNPHGVFAHLVDEELLVIQKDVGAVTTYSTTATGNAPPLRSFTGLTLFSPEGIALTENDEILVANRNVSSVEVYDRFAVGNVSPIRSIGGGATGIAGPTGVTSTLCAAGGGSFAGTTSLFADGFESGNTSRWSSTFPPDAAPDVESVSPADGALHISAETPVVITFSEPMNPATITANTVSTDCSGAVQLSADGFATCVQFAAQPTTSDNTTFIASPFEALASATRYRIRVTTDAQDPSGNPLIAVFTTAIGFTVRYAHSIAIDGINDFTAADEEFATSTVGGKLFVSYDDVNLYVALEHPDVLVGGAGNKFTYFLFSTDAGLATGNPLSSDGKAQFGQAGTSRMLFHWKERIDGAALTEFRIANGSDWNTDWGSGGKSVFRANGFVEASFALTEFGGVAPADLLITAYTVDYDGAGGDGWIYNMLAGAADGPGTPPRPLSGYVHLQLPSSYSPNDAANLDSF